MKKLMMVAGLASTMLCGAAAATYEENLALANTSLTQVTKDNVGAVCDACLAVTNGAKILVLREKGFLTFEQVATMLAGKEEFSGWLFENASLSSNDVLRASCVDSLLASMKTAPAGSATSSFALFSAIQSFKVSPARRMEIGRELIAAGKLVNAIQPIYGALSWPIYCGRQDANRPEYGAEYLAFMAEVADQLFDAWLAAPVRTQPNGRPISCWTDGADIVLYFVANASEKVNDPAVIAKIIRYVKDGGQRLWLDASSKPLSCACREAALESPWFEEDFKLEIAKKSDIVLKSKKTTEALYPSLVNDVTKIKAALYLEDVDKLIDALKTVSDKLDAATVEATIAPLNGVNAGYRTADLRLALANINKKYTLKLYDDRDTWEPILSKIRAMIDAL